MKDATFRDWLVKLRGNRTHQQIADLAGVSRNYYTEIENGIKTPSVDVAQKLGIALGFEWTLFFGLSSRYTRQGIDGENKRVM